MSFLADVIIRKREEVRQAEKAVPLDVLKDRLQGVTRIAGRIQSSILAGGPGLKVIAEFKRKSPSGGSLKPGGMPAEFARIYEAAGACAVSVLADGAGFDGSMADVQAASSSVQIPILRKDFIVDPYQVYETAASGIPSLLLIVAALSEGEYEELRGLCREIKVEPLVEVTNEEEMEKAGDAPLLGVNNRDLHTLKTDRGRSLELMGLAPTGSIVVAESGITSVDQAREAFAAGADAALIGEALMRAEDPGKLIREIRSQVL